MPLAKLCQIFFFEKASKFPTPQKLIGIFLNPGYSDISENQENRKGVCHVCEDPWSLFRIRNVEKINCPRFVPDFTGPIEQNHKNSVPYLANFVIEAR